MIFKLLTLSVIVLTSFDSFASTYIHAGKLITAKDNKVQKSMTVIIDDNKINKEQYHVLKK